MIIAALFLAATISEADMAASPAASVKKTRTIKSTKKTTKSTKTTAKRTAKSAKKAKTAGKKAKAVSKRTKAVNKRANVLSKRAAKRGKSVSKRTAKRGKAVSKRTKKVAARKRSRVENIAGQSSTRVSSNARLGIDLSHHNSLGLWNHINSNGHISGKVTSKHKPAMRHLSNSKQLSFVYIKLTEGATVRDNLAFSHYKEAKQRGLRVGFYHFFSLTSSPEAQFNNFVNSMRAMPNTDLPPVIDFEEITGKIKSKSQKETVYRNLCTLDRLMKNRFKKTPLVYTNRKEYHMFFEGNKRFRGRLWTPRGYANPSISQWWIKINGIPVDFNVKH